MLRKSVNVFSNVKYSVIKCNAVTGALIVCTYIPHF